MADSGIELTASTPEHVGTQKMLLKWLRDHNVPTNTFFQAIMPKIVFCLQNYTRADEKGRPIVTLNLAETTIDTYDTVWKRTKKKRRRWDSAL